MIRALFQKELYIRFAEEPKAFVYTVKCGGFTVKSEWVPISIPVPKTAGGDTASDDESNIVKQLLRKPTHASGDRVG
jgi:hypothetical protein